MHTKVAQWWMLRRSMSWQQFEYGSRWAQQNETRTRRRQLHDSVMVEHNICKWRKTKMKKKKQKTWAKHSKVVRACALGTLDLEIDEFIRSDTIESIKKWRSSQVEHHHRQRSTMTSELFSGGGGDGWLTSFRIESQKGNPFTRFLCCLRRNSGCNLLGMQWSSSDLRGGGWASSWW